MTQPAPPITPLEVLLTTMRRRWEARDENGAVDIAKIAAPYVHARRATAAVGREHREPDQMTDAELHAALDEAGAGMAFPAQDPDDPAGLG